MRLGVGRRGNQDAADYVLTDFRASETPVVTENVATGLCSGGNLGAFWAGHRHESVQSQ